jgi:hypothetical protein
LRSKPRDAAEHLLEGEVDLRCDDRRIASLTALRAELERMITECAYLTPEEKETAQSFAAKRKAYVTEAIQPGLALAKEAKYEELGKLLTNKWRVLYDAAKGDLYKLVAIQIKEAKADFEASRQQYRLMMGTAIALILGCVLAGVLLGSAADREEAERVYALMNQGQAQGYRVDDGIIRKASWRDLFAPFTRSLRARLTTLNAVMALFAIVI